MHHDQMLREIHPPPGSEESSLDSLVTLGADGIARLRGTPIEVHRLAALFACMEVDEILRDYVGLDQVHLDAAKTYADRHPDPTRTYPSVTAKKAMRDANLDDLIPFLPRRAR